MLRRSVRRAVLGIRAGSSRAEVVRAAMALRSNASQNMRPAVRTREGPQPAAPMRLNRVHLGNVFDAAAGAKPGEPAALMGLRRFLQFLSDVAVVPRLLDPAQVAASVVSDATTGQRARDGWKISFNEFILRICLVAELVFGERHSSDEGRQRALLEYLAPSCERLYGVELQVPVVTNARLPYEPSSLVHGTESPLSTRSDASPRVTSAGKTVSLVRTLRQRLDDAERQLRSERKAKETIALHADQTRMAMEKELALLRAQMVSVRQQEQALRSLSPRGLGGRRRGRAVLGALAVGIISRSRANATAGWFQLWVARVRELELRRTVIVARRRADTAVQEAEQALATLTLRDERRQGRSLTVPQELSGQSPSRIQAGLSDAELAISAAKAETEAWQRRAEAEANARVVAERARSEERDALRNALAASEALAARVEEGERNAQKDAAERALLENQLRVEVESNVKRASEAAHELAVARESAESSHFPVVAALQEVTAELREELRASEMEVERHFVVCDRIAAQSGRRWRLWRAFSRWQTLAFICEAKAAANQQKVLLVAVLLHQRRRAQLRRQAFGAWTTAVRGVPFSRMRSP